MKTELSAAQKAALSQLSTANASELGGNINQLYSSWSQGRSPPLSHKELRKKLLSIVASAATGVIKLPTDVIGSILEMLCEIYGSSAYRARQMQHEIPGGLKPLLAIAKKLEDRNAALAIDLLLHAGTVNKSKFGVTMRLEGGVETLCSHLLSLPTTSSPAVAPLSQTATRGSRASPGPDGEGSLVSSVLACLALCCDTSEQNCRLVHKRGCTAILLRMLRAQTEDAAMVEHILVIMAALCEASSGSYTLAQHQAAMSDAVSAGKAPPKPPMGPVDLFDQDPSLCALVVHSVRMHEGSVSVVTAALGLVHAMSLDSSLARQLAMAGAFQCVWTACTRHRDRPAVLSRALNALWRVSASVARVKEARRPSAGAEQLSAQVRAAWLRDGVAKHYVGGGHMLALGAGQAQEGQIDMGQPPCTITVWPLPKEYLSFHCAGLAAIQACLPGWAGHALPRPGWYPHPHSAPGQACCTLQWPPPTLIQAVARYAAWRMQQASVQISLVDGTGSNPRSASPQPPSRSGQTRLSAAKTSSSLSLRLSSPRSASAASSRLDELAARPATGESEPIGIVLASTAAPIGGSTPSTVGTKGRMARTPTPASIVARNTSADMMSAVLQGRTPVASLPSDDAAGSSGTPVGNATEGDRAESSPALPSPSLRMAQSHRSIENAVRGAGRVPASGGTEPFTAIVTGVTHRGAPAHPSQAVRISAHSGGEGTLTNSRDKAPALKPWQNGRAAASALRAVSAPAPRLAKQDTVPAQAASPPSSSASSPREKAVKVPSTATALCVPGATADACWELMRTSWLPAPHWFPELQQVAALLPEVVHVQDMHNLEALGREDRDAIEAACMSAVDRAASGAAASASGFLPAARIAAVHAPLAMQTQAALCNASHSLMEVLTLSSGTPSYPWSPQQVMTRIIPTALEGEARISRVRMTPSGMATLRPFVVPPRALPTAFHCGTPTAALGSPIAVSHAGLLGKQEQLLQGHTHALSKGYLLVLGAEDTCATARQIDLLEPLLLVSPAYRAAVASRMQLKAIARLGIASRLLSSGPRHTATLSPSDDSPLPYEQVAVSLVYDRYDSMPGQARQGDEDEGKLSLDTLERAVRDESETVPLLYQRNTFSPSELSRGPLPVPPICIGTAHPIVTVTGGPQPLAPSAAENGSSGLASAYDAASVHALSELVPGSVASSLLQRPLSGGDESGGEGQGGDGGDVDSDGSEEADGAGPTASWEEQIAERADALWRTSAPAAVPSGVASSRLHARTIRAMRAHALAMRHVRATAIAGSADESIVAEAEDEVRAMSRSDRRRATAAQACDAACDSASQPATASEAHVHIDGNTADDGLSRVANLLSLVPALSFESRFECGNLCSAVRTGPLEYELCLDPDTNTAGHTQWFFFRVQNIVGADGTCVTMQQVPCNERGSVADEWSPHVRRLFPSPVSSGESSGQHAAPSLAYKFHIVNLEKGGSSFNDGMRPWVYYDMVPSPVPAASFVGKDMGQAAGAETRESLRWKDGWPGTAHAGHGFGSPDDPLYIPPSGSPECCHVPTLPGTGWRRSGVQVTYYRNSYARSKPTLNPPQVDSDGYEASLGHVVQGSAGTGSEDSARPIAQYSQSWSLSFPPGCHTAYFAYCIPYTYTDLRRDMVRWEERANRVGSEVCHVPVHEPAPAHVVYGDIDGLGADAYPVDGAGQAVGQPFTARLPALSPLPVPLGTLFTSSILHRSILCHSICGNPVPLLTITDFSSGPVAVSTRPYIVLSARVHPGEANGSWMMRGLLDMLTSSCPLACELRRRVIFKVVPMLNPDGVLNGHHRTNAAGLDLNRHWSTPDMAKAPTIWHLRALIMALQTRAAAATALSMHGEEKAGDVASAAGRRIALEAVLSASSPGLQDGDQAACPGIDPSYIPYARAVSSHRPQEVQVGKGGESEGEGDGQETQRQGIIHRTLLPPVPQPVLLFCDFHGHSKRRDVFMFGCNELASEGVIPVPGEIPPSAAVPAAAAGTASGGPGDEEGEGQEAAGRGAKGVSTRLFPRLLSSRIDTFSMRGCAWKVSKAKLSCARVAVWRDALLNASYTIEATYGGSTAGARAGAHMGAQAYEEVGYAFCAALLDLLEGPAGGRAQEVIRGLLAKGSGGGSSKGGKKEGGGSK